jgi:cytochrome c oxidase subunit 3
MNQGLVIFIYLAILTGLEFFIAIALSNAPLLVLVAIVKTGLVLYYYMHINRLNQNDQNEARDSLVYKTGTNRLGLWLFLLSDSFVFAGLMVARFNLLGLTRPPLNQVLGLGVTAILLLSSFFMNRGETAMSHGDRKGFLINTSITLVLALVFLLGVVAVEWPTAAREGLTPDFGNPTTGPLGAVFYMMTGMHAFHVFTGVLFLIVILRNGARGVYTEEKHWAVEAATTYWHFIDVVWIFFYPALYLIGKLVSIA